jgi:ABC-type multidrug transport system fused ATPase/permease subunit
MARKPTASDFKNHEDTYAGFLTVTKWSVISMIFTVVALYAFIVAGQPWLGVVLLALIPILIFLKFIVGTRS